MGASIDLKIVQGPQAGREFRFDAHDTFVFGRAADCGHSVPDDPFISGRHFLIEAKPPACTVRDLGSKNGTTVNGRLIGRRTQAGGGAPVELKDGDTVGAGKTKFQIVVRRAPMCGRCGAELPAEGAACSPCLEAAKTPPARPGFKSDFISAVAHAFARPAVPSFPGLTLERKLKEGGMGEVHLARRDSDSRQVVVKVVKPNGPVPPERMFKLFKREMEVSVNALKPGHPNIVDFLESGDAGGVCYFVMEFCPGGSVAGLMERRGGRLPAAEAVPLTLQALEGLAYAHSRGIVHRDLKPDNILIAEGDGKSAAKVTDFGLAKNFVTAGLSGYTTGSDSGAGTAEFMPREQLLHFRETKPVSDVFSMGASLYNMLTGAFVYDGPDHLEDIMMGRVVPLADRRVPVPPPLAEVVARATAPEAKDRFQTAAEFKVALLRVAA